MVASAMDPKRPVYDFASGRPYNWSTAAEFVGMPVGLRRGLAVPQRQPLAGKFWGFAATPEACSWPNPSTPVKKLLLLSKVMVRSFKRTAAELVGMPVGLRRGLAVSQRQ